MHVPVHNTDTSTRICKCMCRYVCICMCICMSFSNSFLFFLLTHSLYPSFPLFTLSAANLLNCPHTVFGPPRYRSLALLHFLPALVSVPVALTKATEGGKGLFPLTVCGYSPPWWESTAAGAWGSCAAVCSQDAGSKDHQCSAYFLLSIQF